MSHDCGRRICKKAPSRVDWLEQNNRRAQIDIDFKTDTAEPVLREEKRQPWFHPLHCIALRILTPPHPVNIGSFWSRGIDSSWPYMGSTPPPSTVSEWISFRVVADDADQDSNPKTTKTILWTNENHKHQRGGGRWVDPIHPRRYLLPYLLQQARRSFPRISTNKTSSTPLLPRPNTTKWTPVEYAQCPPHQPALNSKTGDGMEWNGIELLPSSVRTAAEKKAWASRNGTERNGTHHNWN